MTQIDWRERSTIKVDEAAPILGISRSSAYVAAHAGGDDSGERQIAQRSASVGGTSCPPSPSGDCSVSSPPARPAPRAMTVRPQTKREDPTQ